MKTPMWCHISIGSSVVETWGDPDWCHFNTLGVPHPS